MSRFSVTRRVAGWCFATLLCSCGGLSSSPSSTSSPTSNANSKTVPIVLTVSGAAPSFTATFQGTTMTAAGAYPFSLLPGSYTVSGRLSTTTSLGFNLSTTAATGGIAGGILSSSISCGGTNCSPAVSSCGGISACVAPGGEGIQSVAACPVTYVSQSGSSTCVINAGGSCAQRANPYVPLDFRFQFTVDGTSPARASCGR